MGYRPSHCTYSLWCPGQGTPVLSWKAERYTSPVLTRGYPHLDWNIPWPGLGYPLGKKPATRDLELEYPPMWTDKHLWKHYLLHPLDAGGNKISFHTKEKFSGFMNSWKVFTLCPSRWDLPVQHDDFKWIAKWSNAILVFSHEDNCGEAQTKLIISYFHVHKVSRIELHCVVLIISVVYWHPNLENVVKNILVLMLVIISIIYLVNKKAGKTLCVRG